MVETPQYILVDRGVAGNKEGRFLVSRSLSFAEKPICEKDYTVGNGRQLA